MGAPPRRPRPAAHRLPVADRRTAQAIWALTDWDHAHVPFPGAAFVRGTGTTAVGCRRGKAGGVEYGAGGGAALRRQEIHPGDAVGTLAWNIEERLGAYLAAPSMGAVLLWIVMVVGGTEAS